jgi:hypothetical protein
MGASELTWERGIFSSEPERQKMTERIYAHIKRRAKEILDDDGGKNNLELIATATRGGAHLQHETEIVVYSSDIVVSLVTNINSARRSNAVAGGCQETQTLTEVFFWYSECWVKVPEEMLYAQLLDISELDEGKILRFYQDERSIPMVMVGRSDQQ